MLTSTGGSATPGADEGQAQELEFPEIFKAYHERWVAVVVTGRDKNLQPNKGRVVADDVDRYRLREKIIGRKEICIFYAGEPAYTLLL
ncbi:MAG: hypothetical protein JRM80_05470 [Nitrososphaerota archaeon]|nr:hypothetical protein [Nitrososphaerota archaeon]